MDVNDIWSKALAFIRQDIDSLVGYNTYIKDAAAVSFEDNVFQIAVPINISKKMIELRYKELIENSLQEVLKEAVKLDIVIESDVKKLKKQEIVKPPVNSSASYINPKYTFDKFVVGNSNRYAYAVANAAAESPGQTYNPLFLYGNSGLGKTHLMHAIGNAILKNKPHLKVLYVSSERFTNDLINSLRDKTMDEFRRRYRQTDVLLVDDVQFIEGKESTQEEFFHTFNELYNENRQIVLTSDRKPKDLITLEERLRTRFEWGLITDISVPDYETRIAILKKKAESENVKISEEVYDYIAERIKSNIRELEGALIKIISFAGISDRPIDISLAEDSLKAILPEDGIIKITPKSIKERVCTYYSISMEELVGKSRTKEVATARQVAMYLCKKLTDMNFVMIAREFGNRDRTTVMHNVDKVMSEIKENGEFKEAVDFISKDLQTI
ncbi:MAG: chromosomal replication initiator protein DnaA [Clostridia bacterium]|nr:chromosomal replication initiator protein DnaA [Clostridia bacterium]